MTPMVWRSHKGKGVRAWWRRRRLKQAGKVVTDLAPKAAGIGSSLLSGGAPLSDVPGQETAKKILRWTHLDQAFLTTIDKFAARERDRAAATFDRAIEKMIERAEAGEGFRADGFFAPRGELPSHAEEILEGTLRAAIDAHEDRKAERLADLYAYFAFNRDISPPHANFILALVRRLTYEQLLLLGYFSAVEDGPDYAPTGMFGTEELGLTMAIFELAREGLLVRTDNARIQSFAEINPAKLRTALLGTVLVDAMDLTEAEEEDWETLIRRFQMIGKIDADEGQARMVSAVPPGSDSAIQRIKLDKQVVRFVKRPDVSLDQIPAADEEDD
jgi:hypothetical protein